MSIPRFLVRFFLLTICSLVLFNHSGFGQSIITQDQIVGLVNGSEELCDNTIVSNVFPNPASNTVNVVMNSTQDDFTITIYDFDANIQGYFHIVGSKTAIIDVSQLNSGLHFLLFEVSTERCFYQLLIQ